MFEDFYLYEIFVGFTLVSLFVFLTMFFSALISLKQLIFIPKYSFEIGKLEKQVESTDKDQSFIKNKPGLKLKLKGGTANLDALWDGSMDDLVDYFSGLPIEESIGLLRYLSPLKRQYVIRNLPLNDSVRSHLQGLTNTGKISEFRKL